MNDRYIEHRRALAAQGRKAARALEAAFAELQVLESVRAAGVAEGPLIEEDVDTAWLREVDRLVGLPPAFERLAAARDTLQLQLSVHR